MIMPAQDQICPPVKIGFSIFGTVGQKNIQGIGRWFSDQFPDFLSFKLWRKWLFIIDQRYFQTIDSKAGFSHLQAAGFIMQDMDPGCLQLLFIFLISGCHTVLLRICPVQLIFMVSQRIIDRILLSKAPQKGGSFFQRGRIISHDHITGNEDPIRSVPVDCLRKLSVISAKFHAMKICDHSKSDASRILYFVRMDCIMYGFKSFHASFLFPLCSLYVWQRTLRDIIFRIRSSGMYRHHSSGRGHPLQVG